MSNFQPLEVVDRGSETQSQVVDNFNKIRVKCKTKKYVMFKMVEHGEVISKNNTKIQLSKYF